MTIDHIPSCSLYDYLFFPQSLSFSCCCDSVARKMKFLHLFNKCSSAAGFARIQGYEDIKDK